MSMLTPRPITGSPLRWSRDMALVGGGTSAFVPALVHDLTPDGYPLMAAAVGMLTGALLGLIMPGLLDRVRGRVALPALVACSMVLGGAWGGITGALAGAPFGATNALLGMIAGCIAGAVQFGWWWFPYTFQTVRGGRTWPMLLAAGLAMPIVTVATISGTVAIIMGLSPG